MKTYAETQGQEIFDWNQFLENPPESQSLHHRRATDLSGQWVTCACGNLCDIIPRGALGIPFDKDLETLGIRFHALIDDGQWNWAKNTLYFIEKRSAEIIADLSK
jgi:hypothetical protein